MHLVVRHVQKGDFETASLFINSSGLNTARQREIWDLLWREGEPFGVVISDLAARSTQRALGVMVGCFIQNDAVTALCEADRPFALQRLAMLARSSKSPFVRTREIASKNDGDGLNLMFVYYGWQGGIPTEEPGPTLRAFLCNSFADRYAGNRIRFILGETCNKGMTEIASKIGFKSLNPYSGWAAEAHVTEDECPCLVGIDRRDGLDRENPWLTRLFTYFAPKFRFTDYQRQILLLARDGLTDNEIAKLIRARPDAVKKRWSGIYERVNGVFPDLLPITGIAGRGSEKRRALLVHLRDRPEELRPHLGNGNR